MGVNMKYVEPSNIVMILNVNVRITPCHPDKRKAKHLKSSIICVSRFTFCFIYVRKKRGRNAYRLNLTRVWKK